MGKVPADDEELFRAEMKGDGVVPLKASARAALQMPRPKPIAFKRIEDDLAIPAEMMKDTSGWDARDARCNSVDSVHS